MGKKEHQEDRLTLSFLPSTPFVMHLSSLGKERDFEIRE